MSASRPQELDRERTADKASNGTDSSGTGASTRRRSRSKSRGASLSLDTRDITRLARQILGTLGVPPAPPLAAAGNGSAGAEPEVIVIECGKDGAPGETIQLTARDGRTLHATIPAATKPRQQIRVEVPPAANAHPSAPEAPAEERRALEELVGFATQRAAAGDEMVLAAFDVYVGRARCADRWPFGCLMCLFVCGVVATACPSAPLSHCDIGAGVMCDIVVIISRIVSFNDAAFGPPGVTGFGRSYDAESDVGDFADTVRRIRRYQSEGSSGT